MGLTVKEYHSIFRRMKKNRKHISVDQVIDVCGGLQVLALRCGISVDAVRKWRAPTGYVPPKNWPAVVSLSRGEIGYEALERLASSVKSREAA
jgi:hypothetical protein